MFIDIYLISNCLKVGSVRADKHMINEIFLPYLEYHWIKVGKNICFYLLIFIVIKIKYVI